MRHGGGDLGDGGLATDAALSPSGIAVDADGNVYIADSFNRRIRKVGPDGIITTVGGNGLFKFSGDGGPATSAALNRPRYVAVDADGNVYIADAFNGRIRKVGGDGIITTVGGNGIPTGSLDGEGGDPDDDLGDGGPATEASLSTSDITVDTAGNLYIAESGNSRIRKIGPTGIITTVAGNGIPSGSLDGEGGDPADDLGDDGPATSAALNNPRSVAVDAAGNLYIVDRNNARIRKVDTGGIITTVAVAEPGLGRPEHVAVDPAGNLYIVERGNLIRRVDAGGMIDTVGRCCMIQLRREWGRFSNFSFRTPQRRISACPARPSG